MQCNSMLMVSSMFTGLIQGTGYLKSKGPTQLQVMCSPQPWTATLAIGDSVAVDGVCLTVETLVSKGFVVTTSPETLQRTILEQRLDTQSLVNLEPALQVGDRLGGHFVTGHIDGIGTVEQVVQTQDSWEISFQVPSPIADYIVSKGSITVNGISLTVANCNAEGSWFSVAVIPHSFAQTNLQQLSAGSRVNLETDVLGKYVAKFLRSPHLREPSAHQEESVQPISLDFLAEHGFS
ncbi:MAG: riboflavin synthase [Thermosynechococcaceae cyanobacterium]